MKRGMVFPQTEMDPGRAAVLEYATAVVTAGFDYLLTFDHVLGADTASRPDWTNAYSSVDQFHEPFTLIAYLGGVTNLNFITGVLVLPQRQTVLVAKQAAELDLLTEGRFRLGIGLGWNELEYQGLGMDFDTRVDRLEEQIEVLRLLWTHDIVAFEGSHHVIDRAGILPRPSRPIPIWLGTFGTSRPPLERIGRVADGWMPLTPLGPHLERAIGIVGQAAEQSGRDPASIALEGRIRVPRELDLDDIRRQVDAWEELGATHVGIDTLHVGLSQAEHVERAAAIGAAVL
jgi:probable F420-dependent oxidoreductase